MNFKPIEITPLNGAYYPANPPSLTLQNFTSGAFQNEANAYIQKSDEVRPPLIRLYNQLYFWMYGKSTNFVVVGKQNQLFSYDYWSSFIGFNYKGHRKLVEDVQSIKRLQDSLSTMGKEFLYVIAPNKVRCMPEFLPDALQSTPGDTSNYNKVLKLFKQHRVKYLDLNAHFANSFKEYKYPIFANTSTHWSAYGMSLSLQKIFGSLELMNKENVINLKFRNWTLKDSTLNSDKDMSEIMNLILPIETESLAFPKAEQDLNRSLRPVKPFVIGDSFFWNILGLSYLTRILDVNAHFYYYNVTHKSINSLNDESLNKRNARLDVEGSDFVIFVTTEANLGNLTYDFPKRFFEDSKKVLRSN